MYAAVLDACVLFPNMLLAEDGMFRPLWSSRILDELRRNVLEKRPVPPSAFDWTLVLMNLAFEGALVEGWEELVEGLELPDLDDRHVLAAAIVGGAQSIATFNLVDFPAKRLDVHHIDAVHPDTFLLNQLDLAPGTVLAALRLQARRYRDPAMDLSGLMTRLERCGVPQFADEVRRLVL